MVWKFAAIYMLKLQGCFTLHIFHPRLGHSINLSYDYSLQMIYIIHVYFSLEECFSTSQEILITIVHILLLQATTSVVTAPQSASGELFFNNKKLKLRNR